ncbi:uncharacterized protein, partial [Amphiura filiformis]|uniref:uncharacterized protein n=1 Tax=Amphiura filiformis TaxID=82378 RepID=UPI003B21AF40
MTFRTDADSIGAGTGFQLTFTAIDPPSGRIVPTTTLKPTPILGIALNHRFELETGIGDVELLPAAPSTDQSKTQYKSISGGVPDATTKLFTVIQEGSTISPKSTLTERGADQDLSEKPLSTERKLPERSTERGQADVTSKMSTFTKEINLSSLPATTIIIPERSADEGRTSGTNKISTVMEERSTVPSTSLTDRIADQDLLKTLPATTIKTPERSADQGRTSGTNKMSTVMEERSTVPSTSLTDRRTDQDLLETLPATTIKTPERSTIPTTSMADILPRTISPDAVETTPDSVIDGVFRKQDGPPPKPAVGSGCRDVFVEPNGNFTSPWYPNFYDTNMICTWTILADPLEYIALRFVDFDVDNPMPNGACDMRYSYVRISYFDSTEQIASDQFCGSVLPLNVTISYSNQMVVYFFSELGLGTGFVAQYDAFNPNPLIDGAPVFPEIDFLPDDDSLYYIYSSPYYWTDEDDDTDTSTSTCGDIISMSGSVFVSPGYPSGYGVHSSCKWIILAKPKQYIKLEFSHFSVGINSDDDDACYSSPALVTVSYQDSTGHFMSKDLCGSADPSPVIVSMSDQMQVSLTSQRRGQKGFRAEVAFFDADENQNGGDQETKGNATSSNLPKIITDLGVDMTNVASPSPDSEFCKRMQTECCYDLSQGSSRGVIASPGYPGGYDQYLNCKWLIKGDTHQSVSIHFTNFELDSAVEEYENCSFDKSIVRVVYFDEKRGMKEQFFCGHSLPSMIVSDSHTLYVEFYTFGDPKTMDKGFKAVYSKENKTESSVNMDGGGHVFRGLFPFIPVGDDFNETLVPSESLQPYTDAAVKSSRDGITLEPRITKRRRPGIKDLMPDLKTTRVPVMQSSSATSYIPDSEVTKVHKGTEHPWSDVVAATVSWSVSLDYDKSDTEVPEPDSEPTGAEPNVTKGSTSQLLPGGTPAVVAEPAEGDVISSAESVTWPNGTPKSELEPSAEPATLTNGPPAESVLEPSAEPDAVTNGTLHSESEPSAEPEASPNGTPAQSESEPSAEPVKVVINGTLQSDLEPSAEPVDLTNRPPVSESEPSSVLEPSRTAQSHESFTATAKNTEQAITDGITPYLDDHSQLMPSTNITDDAQNATQNGTMLIKVGSRFISVPVLKRPPLDPPNPTPPPSTIPTSKQVLTTTVDGYTQMETTTP